MYTVIIVIHVIVTLLLIGIILLQRSDADGMGGLGGGSGGNLLSGRASANLLTRTTAILAALFMLSSLGLSVFNKHATESSILDAVPAETAAPVTPTPEEPASAPKPDESKKAPAVPKPE